MTEETEVTCRGSVMLGSGCGHCSKCKKEIHQMEDALLKMEGKVVYKQPPTNAFGWVCPVCGRGNAPHSSSCPCVELPPLKVTC